MVKNLSLGWHRAVEVKGKVQENELKWNQRKFQSRLFRDQTVIGSFGYQTLAPVDPQLFPLFPSFTALTTVATGEESEDGPAQTFQLCDDRYDGAQTFLCNGNIWDWRVGII